MSPASAGAAGTSPTGAENGHGDDHAALEVPPAPGLLNVANELTVLRLALVPVFVWFLLAGGTG